MRSHPFPIPQFFCSFIKCLNCPKSQILRKLNNSLRCHSNFVDEMETFIHSTRIFLDRKYMFSNQTKWETLKYNLLQKAAFLKSVKNFPLAWKREMQCVELLNRCLTRKKK